MANLYLIKQLVEKKNMTIAELASRVGVSEQQIHLMCRKNSTKIETLEKVCRVLKVNISYFFDEDLSEVHEVRQAGRDYVEEGNIEHHGTEYAGGVSIEADLREQIAQLKSQLADKERIIKLLERE